MTASGTTRSFLLTAPGAGAIGLIRLTGPDALSILERVFRSARVPPDVVKAEGTASLLANDRLRYGTLVTDDEEVIDDVLVCRVSAAEPPAFDISVHGGVRVVQRALELLDHHGSVFCETKDAEIPIWRGKNRIEQEALDALMTAKTQRAVRFLAWQRQHLPEHLDTIASDYACDPAGARSRLEATVAGYHSATALVEGATVVILGPPNSGKSTLFNRLLGRSATVVSPLAGTTRDWVAEPVEVEGVPITLVDTAGRHETTEPVERLATDKGWAVASRADLCLFLLDGSRPLPVEINALVAHLDAGMKYEVVVNKVDLGRTWKDGELACRSVSSGERLIEISAGTGLGLERLLVRLLDSLGFRAPIDGVPCLFTPRQHKAALALLSDCPATGAEAAETIHGALIGKATLGPTDPPISMNGR